MNVDEPSYDWGWQAMHVASGYNIAFLPVATGSWGTTNMVTVWVTVAPPTGS